MQIYVRATQFAEQTVRVQNSMPRRIRSAEQSGSARQPVTVGPSQTEGELDVK